MDRAQSLHPTAGCDSASKLRHEQGQQEGLRQPRAGMYVYHTIQDKSLVPGCPAPRDCLIHHGPHLPKAD